MSNLNTKICTFLTFLGNAEEAIKFYVSIIPNSKIEAIEFYSKDDEMIGEEGKVINALFTLDSMKLMAMDFKDKEHYSNFSWSTSIFYNCDSEKEFMTIFEALSQNGQVMMGPEPINNTKMEIRLCTWVVDRFGMTWQLLFI